MFGGQSFYHQLFRKYVVTFGSLFNDITIKRTVGEVVTSNSVTSQVIKVPLEYAPKEKMMVRLDSDPTIDRPFSVALPRMSFEFTSVAYDGDRMLTAVGQKVVRNANNTNTFHSQYNPVPYDINFKLYIYVKFEDDASKILEQILPFFTPAFTPTLVLIPTMNISKDIPIFLKSCALEDLYEGKFEARKMLIWTLDFTMKAYFYGPVIDRPVIKFIQLNERVGDANGSINSSSANYSPVIESIIMQPGLLANGSGTINVNNSINAYTIDINSNWLPASYVTPPVGD